MTDEPEFGLKRIQEPGIYLDLTAQEYHADPCPEPSLSSHVAAKLLDMSARHAMAAHPRLNKNIDTLEMDQKRRLQLGSAAHAVLLGKGKQIEIIDADSYRSKAAQQERDDAIDAGLIAILRPDYHTASEMVRVARDVIPTLIGEDHFAEGKGESEVVIAWKDKAGPWCRGMIDRMSNSGIIYDYKTTGVHVAPDPINLGRRIADNGYDLQAAFYKRGLEQLMPEMAGRVQFRFIFQETFEPYEITICELDGLGIEVGRRRASFAISMWQQCLQNQRFDGYPKQIITAEYPAFLAALQQRREEFDERYNALPHDPTAPILHTPKQLLEPN